MNAAISANLVYSPGLDNVIAGETAVSSIEDGLRYRGYAVGDLVERCCFEEVAYLLLHGELPTQTQLRDMRTRLSAARGLPDSLARLLRSLPRETPGMDVARTAMSVFAHYDPDVGDNSQAANQRKAERLIAQMPVAIAEFHRGSHRLPSVAAREDLGHAANFLYMLRGTAPTPAEAKAIDTSLILYAEHEYNASTFTCRVITSTESDLHSAMVGGIGALKGRLHGGANEMVLDMLQAAGNADQAEAWLLAILARKEKVMGFGHRVYKAGDVRAGILKPITQSIANAAGFDAWGKTAAVIEEVMAREKNLHPNVDWPAARLYHALGIDRSLYTPMFVMARIAGWTAHVIEQSTSNRLIRPRGKYIGSGNRTI